MLSPRTHLLLDKQEVMKLNPKQAPIYGECVLTVHLNKRSKKRADVFYLLFTGSKRRHVASTRRVNSATLQTVAPAHGCCEIVTVSLCASKKGSVVVLGEESFEFTGDEAYDSAQFLVANATNQQALNFARFLISAQPRPGDVAVLDKKITLAFKHLQLPSGWNVLGETPLTDGEKQETLMHFAARLGLCHLSKFLLDQPGGRTALTISNSDGATPARLAIDRGFRELVQLFSESGSKGTPCLSDLSHVERFRDCWLEHHLELNVYILTREVDLQTHIRMETLIKDLCRHIEGHSSFQGICAKSEKEPESEESADLCHQDVEKSVTDKTLDLHSDSDGTENKWSTLCSEESCTGDKVEELGVTIDSEVETVGGDGAMLSFSGTSKEPKEEEEGTKAEGDVSVTHQHIQRFPTEVQATESLLSSGNPNEETGMTSTRIVVDHEGLCGRDNLDEEMITTTERATPDVAITEASDKATVLTLASGVDMGQAMPGYCTSAASSKDTVGNTENSEEEMGAVTLLPVNENQAIDSFNDSSGQSEINLCLLNETERCDIAESGQPQECTAMKALDCIEICEVKGSGTSVPASQSERSEQTVDGIRLTAKEGNALAGVDVSDYKAKSAGGGDAGAMPEEEVVVATCKAKGTGDAGSMPEEEVAVSTCKAKSSGGGDAGSMPEEEVAVSTCEPKSSGGGDAGSMPEEVVGVATCKAKSSGGGDAGSMPEEVAVATCKAKSAGDAGSMLEEEVAVTTCKPKSSGGADAGAMLEEVVAVTTCKPKSSGGADAGAMLEEVVAVTTCKPKSSGGGDAGAMLEEEVSVTTCKSKSSGAGSILEDVVAVNTAPLEQISEGHSVAIEEAMPGPCTSPPVETMDTTSSQGTSEPDTGKATTLTVNDNRTTTDQGEPCPSINETGQCDLAEGTGQCVLVEGTGQCVLVEGTGQCDLVEGTGQCDLVEGTGQCDFVEGTTQCDLVESGQSPQSTAIDKLDSAEVCDSEHMELDVSNSQNESPDQSTDGTRRIAEGENPTTEADVPVCSFHDCVGEVKDAVLPPAPSPEDLLYTETPSPVDCVEEEPGEVVKQAPVDSNRAEDSSEVLKVSRASLHPIAEESSLLSGDSSSDNAPASSESEASSVPSDSEKAAHSEEESTGQGMNRPSRIVDCPIENLAAAIVNAVVDSTTKLCMKEMVNAGSGMPENDCTRCSSVQQSDSLQAKKDYEQDTGESIHVCKEDDSGLDLSVNMEETQCPSISDTEIVLAENLEGKPEDEVDFVKDSVFMINRESCCSLTPCPHMVLLDSKQTSESTVCQQFLEDDLDREHSSPQPMKRESKSDTDLCYMAPEVLDEMVFAKLEEEQSLCDVSSLGSDDNTSLERNSSHGSDISIPRTSSMKKPSDRHSMDSSCSSTVTACVEERECEHTGVSEMEGEEMDNITEVSPHVTRSKGAIRSASPPRRHSWEPWKHAPSDSEISRRSMSWCLSTVNSTAVGDDINCRSYSLEGLAGKIDAGHESSSVVSGTLTAPSAYEGEVRSGSSLSLSEEKAESDPRKSTALHHEDREKTPCRGFVYPSPGFAPHLTKSMSLTTISNPLVEIQTRMRPKRRISFSFNISPLVPKSKHVFTVGSSSSDDESDSSQSLNIPRNSLAQSIPEESCDVLPLSPSQKDLDLKGGTKVSRTFSYLRHKMSGGKKTKEKEKDRDKIKEKEKEPKEKDKDKKTINGHLFSSTPVVGPFACNHCTKSFNKDGYICSNCNSIVHKGCRENFIPCAKVKMKQQKVLQPNDTSSLPVVMMRNKGSQPKERPRSAVIAPDEVAFSSLSFSNRRPQTTISISKSISTQNIAGVGCDELIWQNFKSLSQSTDSLHKISRVNASTESLVDEGTDMNEGQLMGEFEADSKQLEAESWSQTVESKFLKQLKKEVVKRQDVIYELMQTEMHHVRTLKIMNEVYYRGMLTELQFEQKVLEKIFPCIDDLLNIHTQFFQRILERKKESMAEKSEHNFVIRRIGDILVNQFSGEKAEHMKRTYGKFCGHHNEAVNYFKDLLSKEKRFQAFIKKKGSSSLVRRLGIPECILLVTQRITKYPVLLQRILQYTKENEIEHQEVEKALSLVKDVISEVNNKVKNYEKKTRLSEVYNKTDSKSIQRMKSGQMFAKEDLKRRKLVRDGNLFLRSSPANRIKEVLAVLLTDVLVFLQEKDQKYVFASLEQKSTVISLKKLIVRKVAHDEKGLFLISMGGKDPEMVEVLTNTKEERDSWIDTIQETMTTMDKDEDEGVPSESEEEKKNWDTKARELRGQLYQKDEQILTLLEEKEKLFQALTLCNGQEENSPAVLGRTLFRANTEEAPRGEPLIKSAIKEVETLEVLVNQYLWSSLVAQESGEIENGVGPVSLPRRAETFGGFDSHQLSASKCGEKDEVEDAQDLRRTESDSVLKKGVSPSVVVKRNGMQVLLSVSNLHKCLKSLQAVVVQQDTYIEDQKMMLSKDALNRKSRQSSLSDQEKQRSLEKLRQEISNLEKQQAQHKEEKLRNEWQWESREKKFAEWKEWSSRMDEDLKKSVQDMEQKKNRLEIMKAFGQCDIESLEEDLRQGTIQEQRNKDPKQVSFQHDKLNRVPSLPVAMDSLKWCDSNSTKQEQLQSEASTSPKKDSLLRTDSKQKGKGHFNLLGSQSNKSAEGHSSNRLFNLSKPKEKKDKKKKSKGAGPVTSDCHHIEGTEEEEIFC
ncbi:A-kinase anchor protein 13 isoform X4 [Rana temporaria]|uniref:A-kinase anchor protein 13 isoform X4 n=1 Tax=Rana temporaria TaxID=8407 RepID=UPI001AACC84B|nr:A-kinase anchor protein 13 isoform X4 [Rana temporaria]